MTQVQGAGFSQAALAGSTRPAQQSVAPAGGDDRAALEKAAKAFEAVFTRQLLSSMRQASLGEDIAGSSGVDQFREMSDAHMANGLAEKGGLGIADLILQQLERRP